MKKDKKKKHKPLSICSSKPAFLIAGGEYETPIMEEINDQYGVNQVVTIYREPLKPFSNREKQGI